jgi:very-short-patch-repair endonuclease
LAAELTHGIYIHPQDQVEKYRVDFVIYQHGIGPDEIFGPVIVELDGHDFHDKDKHQRSYEKARDRFLVKKGYRVLHFTGSDVVADPFKVAYEALEMVGCFSLRNGYNKNDPLGAGL